MRSVQNPLTRILKECRFIISQVELQKKHVPQVGFSFPRSSGRFRKVSGRLAGRLRKYMEVHFDFPAVPEGSEGFRKTCRWNLMESDANVSLRATRKDRTSKASSCTKPRHSKSTRRRAPSKSRQLSSTYDRNRSDFTWFCYSIF